MATITRENIGLLNDKLTVTVAKDDYIPSFEKALKQYSKSANIPGFRKGMVPSGVIRKMHGPAIFKDEVVKSVEKELGRYLGEEKPEIFAQPLPLEDGAPDLDMNRPADYHFQFEIGLKPEVRVDLKSIKAARYVIDITDAMLDEEIERLRNRHGKVVEKEAVDSDDDILNVTFTEVRADEPSGEGALESDAEAPKSKDNSLLVKYFSESFRPQLFGKKVGDTFEVQLTPAFEEKEREWLIKDLDLHPEEPGELEKHFHVAITRVGLLEKRALAPDFYKEVFAGQDLTTEAEFREKLRQDMQTYWNRQSREYLHHELYHLLLDGTRFDLPDTFLRRWLLVGGDKPKGVSEVDAEFPTFRSQLRWTLVSDKLIRDNGLDVNPDELRAYLKAQVMGYFGSSVNVEGGNLEWVDAYVERMLKDEQQVETAYRRIVTDKMFQWAEGQVTLAEKTISLEEFSHMQQEHQHHHHEH